MLASKFIYASLITRPVSLSIRIAGSLNKSSVFSIRKFSSKYQQNKAPKLSAMDELRTNWEPIYRFPKIRLVSAINKLKNYQIAATVVSVPVTFLFFNDHLLTVTYLGTTVLISLSIASFILKNSIGAVYVSKTDKDLVRIAYINFWGSRNDISLKVDDIVPLSHLPDSMTSKIYTKLKFNNGQEELKLLSKDYEVIDFEQFSRIFGD